MKRNTHQLQTVIDSVAALKGEHPTADIVFERARESVPSISRATVYRILSGLAQENAVRRVQVPGTADRFDDRLGPHYHMRCATCGRVFDVEYPVMELDLHTVSESSGFMVTGHDVVFHGVCVDCQ